MKLVTYEGPPGALPRIGALSADGKRVVDLRRALRRVLEAEGRQGADELAGSRIPADMTAFLEGDGLPDAARAMAAAGSDSSLSTPLSEVRLHAPLPRPASLRDFLAFEDHVKAGAARRNESVAPSWYEMPIYYKGNHRSIYGPEDEVPWPRYTDRLDFELEIACVIGRRGRDITVEEAPSYIAGYAILNDWSARDIQKKEMACRLGPAKGKDFATSLGPWLVTADEAGEIWGRSMQVRVNGEVWSRNEGQRPHWSFAQMIAHVSMDEDIYPGDVLGSGSYYKGCGLDLDRWLKPGDMVELDVEGLGVLGNRVGRKVAAAAAG